LAIASVGKALVGIIEDAIPVALFPDARAAFYQANDFRDTASTARITEGLSWCLYRVEPNPIHRNRAPRVAEDGSRFRPSLPVDLCFLLTAWARTADQQSRLLGWAMRTLDDTPTLPAAVLNRYAPGSFRANESLDLICESPSLADFNNIHELMKPAVTLSVAYVARVLFLDSTVPLVEGPDAQTRVLRYAVPAATGG